MSLTIVQMFLEHRARVFITWEFGGHSILNVQGCSISVILQENKSLQALNFCPNEKG